MASNKQRLILGLAFNKLADLLVSAKTTLPALLIFLGAPTWMISWLVPIRESGALLPQAIIGVYLRRQSARHAVWRIGMGVQIAAICATLAAALILEGVAAGAFILGALIVLSLGRSACSLTVKDIEADVAQKGERGRLVGIASTVSGLITLCAAVPLVYFQQQLAGYTVYGLLAASAVAFGMTMLCILPIKTYIDTVGSKTGSLFDWHFDSTVYRFIFVRGLFVHSALVAPYFMLENAQHAQSLLPIYLAAQALASLTSSFIWGKLADTSARLTLQIAGAIALLACVGLLVMESTNLWLSAGLFFMLSVAHSGVRTGRKTYSLDVKKGHQRTELVSFSNTAIGLILLAFGGIYAIVPMFIDFSVVYVMTVVLLLAVCFTWILPKEK